MMVYLSGSHLTRLSFPVYNVSNINLHPLMSRPKWVFKQKFIKISESQQGLLNEIMATGAFTMEAEVFRQGLKMMHKAFTIPAYLRPTVNQEIKIEQQSKVKSDRAIPDEEFVAKNLQDIVIYTDEDQHK